MMIGWPVFLFIPFTSHLSLSQEVKKWACQHSYHVNSIRPPPRLDYTGWEPVVMVNPFDDGKINDACMEENIRSCNKFVRFGGLERIMFGRIIKEPLCCQLLSFDYTI